MNLPTWTYYDDPKAFAELARTDRFEFLEDEEWNDPTLPAGAIGRLDRVTLVVYLPKHNNPL